MNESNIKKIQDVSGDQNSDVKNDSNLNKDSPDLFQNLYDNYKSVMIKYPRVGPFFAFSHDLVEEISSFNDFVLSYSKFYSYLTIYQVQFYAIIYEAWIKFNKESSIITIDSNDLADDYKKLIVDIFEKEFTTLLNSKVFLDNYLKLSNEYTTLSKIYQQQFNKFLKFLNYPTKEDIDSMVEELTFFRKNILNLNQLMGKRIENDANKSD